MKIDKNGVLGYSPVAEKEESCFITPINETYNSYKCLVSGYQSSDFWKEGEFDLEELESTLPELYKDLKIVDKEGRHWYPQVVNIEDKGIVFMNGTSKDDYGWCSIKNIPVPDDEKERFKNPQTGEYIKYKSDPTSLKQFNQFEFIEALDSLGIL